MWRLTSVQRDELKRILSDCRMGGMFGDGLELEYILDGFPNTPGLNEMSDEELVKEYSECVDEDDEFLKELKAELEIEKILT